MSNSRLHRVGVTLAVLCAAVGLTLLVFYTHGALRRFGSRTPMVMGLRLIAWSVAVWAWGFAFALIYGVWRRRLRVIELARRVWPNSRIAVWLPVVLLLAGLAIASSAPIFLLIALLAIRNIAALIGRRIAPPRPLDTLSIAGRTELTPLPRLRLIALVCSVSIHCGALVWVTRTPAEGLSVLSLPVLALLWISASVGAYRPRVRFAWPHAVASWTLAAVVILVMTGPRGYGGIDVDSNFLTMLAAPQPGRHYGSDEWRYRDRAVRRGLVLYPAGQHVPAKLKVALPVPRVVVTPMRLAFSGEFRIYRLFDRDVHFLKERTQGNLLDASYSTTDGSYIAVEAWQRLDEPIEAASCRAIEIGLVDRDPYPNTISVLLLLLDRHREAGFGRDMFDGASVHRVGTQRLPEPVSISESHTSRLRFEIRDASVKRFNELQFHFILAPSRGSKSPRIAIEDIVLSPR